MLLKRVTTRPRKNKREVPKEFLPRKNRKEKSSIFGFQENCTLVSYCPEKNRSVILISSMHHDNAIDEQRNDEKIPIMITDYNHTKIGVDLVDQLCQKYNVARNTCRWPMVIFYNLLNISGINALCVYKSCTKCGRFACKNHMRESCTECLSEEI